MGGVCFEKKKTHPELGDGLATHVEMNSNEILTWIDHQSLRSLMYPRNDWFQMAWELEELFINHHGSYRIQKYNAMGDLLEKAYKKYNVLQNIKAKGPIETYIRFRTYVRVKELNLNLKGSRRVLYSSF